VNSRDYPIKVHCAKDNGVAICSNACSNTSNLQRTKTVPGGQIMEDLSTERTAANNGGRLPPNLSFGTLLKFISFITVNTHLKVQTVFLFIEDCLDYLVFSYAELFNLESRWKYLFDVQHLAIKK
jgi:hypothetical protein